MHLTHMLSKTIRIFQGKSFNMAKMATQVLTCEMIMNRKMNSKSPWILEDKEGCQDTTPNNPNYKILKSKKNES